MLNRAKAPFDIDAAHKLLRAGKSYREVARLLSVKSYHTVQTWTAAFPYVEPPPKPIAKPSVPKSAPLAAPDLKKQIELAVRNSAAHLSASERGAVERHVMESLGQKPPTPAELGCVGLDDCPGGEAIIWVTSDPFVFKLVRESASGRKIVQMTEWHPSLAQHRVFCQVQVIWHITPEFGDPSWEASKRLQESLNSDGRVTHYAADYRHVPSMAFRAPESARIESPNKYSHLTLEQQLKYCWRIDRPHDNNDAEALRAPGSALVAGTE